MDVPLPRRAPPTLRLVHFVVLMIVVIAVQGTYLGYFVGILTTLEKRFGISSEQSGLLLSFYDIGHTIAILVVGYLGTHKNLPRITGIGVILSSFAMLLLASPVIFFGTMSPDKRELQLHREKYVQDYRCDSYRDLMSSNEDCKKEHREHTIAYVLLSFGQVLAGIFAAPFNTLAYVYIDNNVEDRRKSPLLLGLLTSMYAFGPALGFALAAGLTRVYTTLGAAPLHTKLSDEHWVGAWWMGFILCSILYLLTAIPFFFFPSGYRPHRPSEGIPLTDHHFHDEGGEKVTGWNKFILSIKEFPLVIYDLMRNYLFISMVIAWMFGSYLIGGYQTYLPKYIESQFGKSASLADVYAGMISIGAVAASTALGGWILTNWDIPPRRAILCLLGSWSVIVLTYVMATFVGCEQPSIHGLQYNDYSESMFINTFSMWSFYGAYSGLQSCSADCLCDAVPRIDPVNFDGENFFSPCHAGCREYDIRNDLWSDCGCAMDGYVQKGLITGQCNMIYVYIVLMFCGLFVGNLFFMVTMMIVLRSVYDDQKVMALSLASCITNLFGFIPAPVIFGWIIDKSCILWSSKCPNDPGNCAVYDNSALRFDFHLANAVLQALAVIFVFVAYLVSRRIKLPEEESPVELELHEMHIPRQHFKETDF